MPQDWKAQTLIRADQWVGKIMLKPQLRAWLTKAFAGRNHESVDTTLHCESEF